MNDWLTQIIQKSQTLTKSVKFFYQFLAACYWIWEFIIKKILVPFRIAGGWLWTNWRYLWDKTVYDRNNSFSYTRAGTFLTGTLILIYFIPTFFLLLVQTTFYFVTVQEENVYLTQSQEIYPDDDIHSIKGCSTIPCNDRVAIYYRVAPSTFHHIWSLVNQGDIFLPDNVAAAVPPGLSSCKVKSYGFRAKILMRKMDIYPDALEISCEPVKS